MVFLMTQFPGLSSRVLDVEVLSKQIMEGLLGCSLRAPPALFHLL